MRVFPCLVLASLLSLTSACGSESEVAEGPAQVTSQSGNLSGLFSPDPDPPVVGENRVTVSLTDANSKPVQGATLSVEPWMPAHGHGSHEVPVVTELGDGDYAVDVTLRMPGFWELRTQVTSSSLNEKLVVGFDVH